MLTAVIFDFDGVIVDTEPIHYRAFQRVLEPLGLGYTWDEYVDRYMGFDDRDAFHAAFRAAGKRIDDHELERLIRLKAAAFQDIIVTGVNPYPGVIELVKSISGRFPLALCSGALTSDILPILKQLGLSDAFDVIVTAQDVAASKPDPASYLLAIERLLQAFPGTDIRSQLSLAIEDTPAGVSSASAAGLKVLAVTNSYPAERLTGAIRVVETLARITLEELSQLI